ncbi:unnamed protein product, partial [Prunus brigantina]
MRCFVRNLTGERGKRKTEFFWQLPEKQIGEEDKHCTRLLAVQWELPFLATVFSSFLPPTLAKSDEGKEVKIYAGPRGASDSMQASIPWFFERLWLGTC